MLKMAMELSKKAHKDQVDKGGEPYFYHPLKVSESFEDHDLKIVALLHDVCEDSEYTPEDLLEMGFSPQIVEAIKCLTKDSQMDYMEYLKIIKNNEMARLVKIEDLKHNSNLSRIKAPTEKDLKRLQKYKKALKYLLEQV